MMFNTMTKLAMIAITVGTFALSGCSTLKQSVGDNSLDYTKTRKFDPILLPANAQTQPFVPLYTVPQSGENTLTIKGEKGKRFELPRPVSTIK